MTDTTRLLIGMILSFVIVSGVAFAARVVQQRVLSERTEEWEMQQVAHSSPSQEAPWLPERISGESGSAATQRCTTC